MLKKIGRSVYFMLTLVTPILGANIEGQDVVGSASGRAHQENANTLDRCCECLPAPLQACLAGTVACLALPFFCCVSCCTKGDPVSLWAFGK